MARTMTVPAVVPRVQEVVAATPSWPAAAVAPPIEPLPCMMTNTAIASGTGLPLASRISTAGAIGTFVLTCAV